MKQSIYSLVIDELLIHLKEMKAQDSLYEVSSSALFDYFSLRPNKSSEKAFDVTLKYRSIKPEQAKPIESKPSNLNESSKNDILPLIKSSHHETDESKNKTPDKKISSVKISESSSFYQKEVPNSPLNESLEDIRKILHKISPRSTYFSDLPSDAKAKEIRFGWKDPKTLEPFLLLVPIDQKDEIFKKIAEAITKHFAPCLVYSLKTFASIEELKKLIRSISLKLIMTTSEALKSEIFNSLYKKNSETNSETLEEIPLFMLSTSTDELQEASFKKQLWETLCRLLPQRLR